MHETVSALRIDLYDCQERPSEIVNREAPVKATHRAWIPQTLGDQIWLLYVFPTVEDREEWERGLSPLMCKWLDRSLLPHALDHFGAGTRDVNGFPG